MTLKLLETSFVLVLFLGYLILWATKRRAVKQQIGADPEVFGKGADPLQRYLARATKVLTATVVVLVAVHALGWQGNVGLKRLDAIDSRWGDIAGLATGLLGLLICHIAQRTMGAAWRVGLDVERRTDLITSGLFHYIRNPTYLGLFLVNGAVWLIWPTWAIGTFVLVFVLFIEVQVRCEERHLLAAHGDVYVTYLEQTKRYIPGLY